MPDRARPLYPVVAGGGVAALELVLALNALACDRVAVTVVAPEADFTYRPPSCEEPFTIGHAERYLLGRNPVDLHEAAGSAPHRAVEVPLDGML